MKRIITLLLAGCMVFGLAACGNTQTNEPAASQESTTPQADSAAENESDTKQESFGTENDSSEEEQEETDMTEGSSNILVAYFSLAGEQYQVGVVEEGNTSIIAHMIAEQTGADLFEIEPVTPYPETYSGLLEVSQEEMGSDVRPEINGTVENMDQYDTVFIGYPNWWGDMPMIVYHFLESYDFGGKTVIPFCTHGGSGLSRTESTIADITGADMLEGFEIAGQTAQNDRERSLEEVTSWLNDIGVTQ